MANRKPKTSPDSAETHPPSEHLEMRIPARAEWVRVVRLATAGVASRAGFAYDDIEDIKLAVTEACNNAILHSLGDSHDSAQTDSAPSEAAIAESTPIVTIRWRVVENGVRISVSDEGRLASYVPASRAASTPDSTVDELPEGGMGLLLIESLMDEVEHESGSDTDTTIHMMKKVPAPVHSGAHGESAQGTTSARPDPDAPVSLKSGSAAGAHRAATPPSSR